MSRYNQKREKQAQLGVPHSRIQVELGFILQAGTCQIFNFPKIQDRAKFLKFHPNLVQIRPVTAEILLIWTNIPRQMMPGQMSWLQL